MSEVQYFSNIMGFAGDGGVGYFPVSKITRDFSPVALADGDWRVEGGIEGFWAHDSQNYRQNFLFGDGHVEFRSFPSTLGDQTHYFNSGSWGVNIKDTPWDALSD